MILKELTTVFDTIFYKNLALDWDKTGLRVGNIQKDIRKILVTLDLTDSVIQEAIRAKADLLLSHHPLLMEPIDSFLDTSSPGAKILEIISNGMAVYTAHTNYDIMPEGLNMIFAEKLGLTGIKSAYLEPVCGIEPARRVEPVGETKVQPYEKAPKKSAPDTFGSENKFTEGGLGIIGELDIPVKLPVFFKKVKENLQISGFRWIANNIPDDTPGRLQMESAIVKKILVLNGSANSFAQRIAVTDFDCDAVIVGELNYHNSLEITESGKIIIEIGHGDSEKFAVEGMCDILNKYFKENGIKDIEVIKSKEGYKSWRYYIG
ncbi:MAG: Nif3-like dinuclear metal center hexameric protein [Actinobacteria bacterium]|nr:Nif3-like dinuclear metal center hexameric protein [Actinomycetota bacterium]